MAQVDETLGGLRVIKAFIAEKKMASRFNGVTDAMRKRVSWVNLRQSLAHPVSEFLGTVMIAIVLWFGGNLILRGRLHGGRPHIHLFHGHAVQHHQPHQGYLQSCLLDSERDGVHGADQQDSDAENGIVEAEHPLSLNSFGDSITFDHVYFRYPDGGKHILEDIQLTIPKGRAVAIVGAFRRREVHLVDLIPRSTTLNPDPSD